MYMFFVVGNNTSKNKYKVVYKMVISLIRTILLYIIIILAIKIMGKRQISDLQTSELVVTLMVSNIATIPMQNTAQPLLSGVVPILVLVCCEILISIFMLKNSRFRKMICGKPIVIINDGKIQQDELRNLRLSVEDLCQQLRQIDVFSIEDVAFAIIETNGKLSVLKKSEKQPPDASSMGIVVPEAVIDTVVISDGEISDYSLSLCGLTRGWIMDILKKKKLSVGEVFIMTANKNKEYNIIKKEI